MKGQIILFTMIFISLTAVFDAGSTCSLPDKQFCIWTNTIVPNTIYQNTNALPLHIYASVAAAYTAWIGNSLIFGGTASTGNFIMVGNVVTTTQSTLTYIIPANIWFSFNNFGGSANFFVFEYLAGNIYAPNIEGNVLGSNSISGTTISASTQLVGAVAGSNTIAFSTATGTGVNTLNINIINANYITSNSILGFGSLNSVNVNTINGNVIWASTRLVGNLVGINTLNAGTIQLPNTNGLIWNTNNLYWNPSSVTTGTGITQSGNILSMISLTAGTGIGITSTNTITLLSLVAGTGISITSTNNVALLPLTGINGVYVTSTNNIGINAISPITNTLAGLGCATCWTGTNYNSLYLTNAYNALYWTGTNYNSLYLTNAYNALYWTGTNYNSVYLFSITGENGITIHDNNVIGINAISPITNTLAGLGCATCWTTSTTSTISTSSTSTSSSTTSIIATDLNLDITPTANYGNEKITITLCTSGDPINLYYSHDISNVNTLLFSYICGNDGKISDIRYLPYWVGSHLPIWFKAASDTQESNIFELNQWWHA